ncbi:MAG: electron transfer flavoprotein-ubiquinone oxidoreductase [Desulfatitalea sp.]|nr:electron transfer flavoprotein-ubiquinone oxidoreductase [Desulfatitalea sp.]
MQDREVLEVDVLFVGAGIASLSGALHLLNLIKDHNQKITSGGSGKPLEEVSVAVVEKGAYVGAHNLSGAVIIPDALKALVPDAEKTAPLEAQVTSEDVWFMTQTRAFRSPITPPFLNNHGAYVISLSKLTQWLGELAEENGVDIFPGFAGTEVLYDGNRVMGIRTGDKGVDEQGQPKENFEPGIDVHAKVTVFGEGTRGNLVKTLIGKHRLDQGKNAQTYVVGVKEVWEIPEGRIEAGKVIHTAGYPLKQNTYGGGFVYGMKNNCVTLGLIIGLDYKDPALDPHREFQKFKLHPDITKLLEGGRLLQYGAKTAPVGGYFAIPQLTLDGGMLIGDAATLFNSQKIKGVHIAQHSGMLAAETIFQGLLTDDFSKTHLAGYEASLYAGDIGKELYKARNYHQAFHHGLILGAMRGGLQYLLGGRDWSKRLPAAPDSQSLGKMQACYGTADPTGEQMGDMKYDGKLTFDRETDTYHSGVLHEERQPCHLQVKDRQICVTTCWEAYRSPCTRFCPAKVYEIRIDPDTADRKLVVNFTNCLHCKTCDVKDPFDNITWVPPEGEGGPQYTMV